MGLPIQPFAHTRGSRTPRVLIVGEAWGLEEQNAQAPFVVASGKELDRMLHQAGIPLVHCLYTNLVDAKPPANDFTHFLYSNKAAKGTISPFRGIYPKPELLNGLAKLEALIDLTKPEIIIALGNWPLWALGEDRVTISTQKGFKVPSGVMNWRGSQLFTRKINDRTYALLPTIHPAAVLRAWDLRRLVVHDLKARAATHLNPAIHSHWGEKKINATPAPTISEIRSYLNDYILRLNEGPLKLSVDIETTQRKWITCVGLADRNEAICIPLFYFTPDGKAINYLSEADEIEVWCKLRHILQHPNCQIIGQNFAYDTQYFARTMGIHCEVTFDTMLAHHVCFPGTGKSLDMLASLYATNYVYWKDESQEWSTETGHETNWLYNCKDTAYTYEIAKELEILLSHFNLHEQYQCQLDQWRVLRRVNLKGVNFNLPIRAQMKEELVNIASDMENYLLGCMPPDLRTTPTTNRPWFTSPTFTADIFYNYLGIQPVLHKKTKKPTVDASSFETLKKRAPWLSTVIDVLNRYRSIGVFVSHFLEAPLSIDQRMKTAFNVGGTDTFRLSSSSNPFGEGTNLQNIPKGDK